MAVASSGRLTGKCREKGAEQEQRGAVGRSKARQTGSWDHKCILGATPPPHPLKQYKVKKGPLSNEDIMADKPCNNPVEGNTYQVKCMMGQVIHSFLVIH